MKVSQVSPTLCPRSPGPAFSQTQSLVWQTGQNDGRARKSRERTARPEYIQEEKRGMQQAVAPNHSLGDTLSLKDTARSAALKGCFWHLTQRDPTGCGSYVAHGGFPALLWPLFLHGGQVISQCHSPEEHHAGQPARPQSFALRAGADRALGSTGRAQGCGSRWGRRQGKRLHSAGRGSGRSCLGEAVAQNSAEPKGMG